MVIVKDNKMNLIDDATLLKMAEAEILKEAKQAAVRHSVAGVSGWQPCPKPNKTFLTNTLLQTMASNRLLTRKQSGKGEKKHKKERKLLQKSSKADKSSNFLYQKPKKSKEESSYSVKNNKVSSHNRNLKTKELIEKCNIKKIKLKKD